MALFDSLFSQIPDLIESSLRRAFAPVAPYLRRLLTGVGAAVVAAFCMLWVLAGLSLALFFELAGLPYVAAALWVTLAWVGICLLFVGVARVCIRPPRR